MNYFIWQSWTYQSIWVYFAGRVFSQLSYKHRVCLDKITRSVNFESSCITDDFEKIHSWFSICSHSSLRLFSKWKGWDHWQDITHWLMKGWWMVKISENIFLPMKHVFSGSKTLDQGLGAHFCLIFLSFCSFFRPALGVHSTQTLVEIYDICWSDSLQ